MSTPCSMRLTLADLAGPGAAVALFISLAAPGAATAQHVVFDPKNHLENALQAARQLESLANEARSLAASPYSHLADSRQSLQDMAELARSVRGLSSTLEEVERQFQDLYPEAANGSDLLRMIQQGQARSAAARRTAEDLARTAAQLQRAGGARAMRVEGALAASDAAEGQTAAVQSTNQLLAVLAEDLAGLRTVLLAQSRLMAEERARGVAEETAGDAARSRRWGREVTPPQPPRFDPMGRAGS